jgi:hypothetical protein
MKTVKHNFLVLEMYDSIEELPITRFQLFNKYLLMDSGIGSSIADVDNHINKVISFIGVDNQKAKVEVLNMRQNIAMVMANVSPEMNCFVVMIKTINGVATTDSDMTEEGIQQVIKTLSKRSVPYKFLKDVLSAIKKKLTSSLNSFSLN